MLTHREISALIMEKDKTKAEAIVDAMTEEEAKAVLKLYMSYLRGDRWKEESFFD